MRSGAGGQAADSGVRIGGQYSALSQSVTWGSSAEPRSRMVIARG